MRKHGLLGVVCAGLLAWLSGLRVVAADGDADADLEMLRAAGKKTETASLLQFVAQQAKHDVNRAQVERLIEQLGGDEFEKREKATAALLALGPSALAALRPALQHKDPEIANRVANCVKQFEQEQTLVGVAVRVLTHRHSEGTIPTLLRNPDPDIRCLCLNEVEAVGTKVTMVVPTLLDASADPVEAVRHSADSVLQQVVRPEDFTTLLKAATDRRARVRAEAVLLLCFFHERGKAAVPTLLAALHDESTLVRRQAAAASWRYGSQQGVVPGLVEALKDKDVRESQTEMSVAEIAASSLGSMGKPARPAIPALIEAIRAEPPALQHAAAVALGQLGAKDDEAAKMIVPVMIQILSQKENHPLRGLAALVLDIMGPNAKPAAPHLIKALDLDGIKDPKTAKMVRWSVLSALAKFGPDAKEAVPKLIVILRDTRLDPEERETAAEALGNVGPDAKAAIPALKEATYGLLAGDGLSERARAALKAIQP
jgi:HEAT repeat protein